MDESTNGASPMSSLPTCEASAPPISSPGSLDGHTPCDLRDGPQMLLFGVDRVPVSHFPKPASVKARPMSATSGPSSAASLLSADLQSSLANKFRERMDLSGSPEYVLKWKTSAMESGPPICRLHARKRRIGETDSSGLLFNWPTPTDHDGAMFASWPTCQATDDKNTSGGRGREKNPTLRTATEDLVPWVSPTAQDHSRGGLPPRSTDTGIPLTQQVTMLTNWATPTKHDGDKSDRGRKSDQKQYGTKGRPLGREVFGLITESSSAGTSTSGQESRPCEGFQLNPSFSRWLIGYPEVWDEASPNYADWCAVQERIASGGSARTETPLFPK